MDNTSTEEHIKNTAKDIFFPKGRLNAKTQEIADAAGVNRALIHYYFRSRENLFNLVLKDAMDKAYQEIYDIISGKQSFEERIRQMVSMMVDRMMKYPYMETFIISEIIKKPENILMLHTDNKDEEAFKNHFKIEIQEYIDKNQLPHIKPEHFMANLMSMCAYPSVAKPLLMNMFQYDEQQYQLFLEERKQVITQLLLGNINRNLTV